MAQMHLQKIKEFPEYQTLVKARKRVVWPLAMLVLVVYFAFILAIAFKPSALGMPVAEGVTSLGIVLGLGVILFCFAVTGFYIYYANTVLAPLTRAIQKKAGETR